MADDNKNSKDLEQVPFWSFKSTRFWLAMMLMFLVFVAVNMRTNIGIAMVCMVNSTAYTSHKSVNISSSIAPRNPECQKPVSPDEVEDLGYHGTYLWTPEMQGALISSTSYGSLITIMFAGLIADTYGPRLACLSALFLYTIMTLLSPMIADLNYYAFLVARSIMGLSEEYNLAPVYVLL
uniref:Major facilitator superfamily (MFS) profile domain-containing protein n=1 Tax=Acrobeloides nanus TaxID=290746 RepID=A0A914CRG5_9BILA